MISLVNSATVHNAYSSHIDNSKGGLKGASISKQGDMSKVDRIKESIESGEYKINLEALSKKIADELL